MEQQKPKEDLPENEEIFGEQKNTSDLSASLVVSSEPIDRIEIAEENAAESKDLEDMWRRDIIKNKFETILKTWQRAHHQEQRMKTWVAITIFALLGLEMGAVGVSFFFIGFKMLEVETWVAETFIGGIIVQIFGIATIVVKSLFPQKSTDTIHEMNGLVKDLNEPL